MSIKERKEKNVCVIKKSRERRRKKPKHKEKRTI